jgi:hypothetical protein
MGASPTVRPRIDGEGGEIGVHWALKAGRGQLPRGLVWILGKANEQ